MKLPSLRIIGAWGAALTVVILAMSVLLRPGTRIEAGEAVSMLPGAMEQAARIAHRLAAMGVGVLAALALVLAWKEHPVPRARRYAVVAIVGLTLLLASIGRYTPGYRIDAVTIANVAGGVALAAAFALLRAAGGPETRIDGVAAGALGLLLVLAGLGAATDAAALRGEHAFGPVHFWVAALFIGLALAAAWHQRQRVRVASVVAALAGIQFVLGSFSRASARSRSPGSTRWWRARWPCCSRRWPWCGLFQLQLPAEYVRERLGLEQHDRVWRQCDRAAGAEFGKRAAHGLGGEGEVLADLAPAHRQSEVDRRVAALGPASREVEEQLRDALRRGEAGDGCAWVASASSRASNERTQARSVRVLVVPSRRHAGSRQTSLSSRLRPRSVHAAREGVEARHVAREQELRDVLPTSAVGRAHLRHPGAHRVDRVGGRAAVVDPLAGGKAHGASTVAGELHPSPRALHKGSIAQTAHATCLPDSARLAIDSWPPVVG